MSELLDSIEVLSRARELTKLVTYLSLEDFCQNIIHQLYIPYFFVSNEFDLKVISIELLSSTNSYYFVKSYLQQLMTTSTIIIITPTSSSCRYRSLIFDKFWLLFHGWDKVPVWKILWSLSLTSIL